jgi:molecular chaperone HscB
VVKALTTNDMDASSLRCRSCDAAYDGREAVLRCPACHAVVPPHPSATPFARLGVPVSLRLTDADIDAAWLARSRLTHPDRFAARPPAERRAAAEQTAALNDARRALATRFDRAAWLVRSVGVTEPALPHGQLVWFMEVREEAEASAEGRQRVVDDAVARFQSADRSLDTLLTSVDAAAPDRGVVAQIASLLTLERTLARLCADLGGPVLVASLDAR